MKGKCPICNKSNNCSMHKGENPAKCWCMNYKITNEVKEFLHKNQYNQCVCIDCLERLKLELS